jgi:hypothetical protein
MKLALSLVVALLLSLGTACGSTSDLSLPAAERHAVAACGLVIEDTEDGGRAWSSPSLSPSETTWGVLDPLDELTDARDMWNEQATAATAAAQENGAFRRLADVTTNLASFRTLALRVVSESPESVAQLVDDERVTDRSWREQFLALSNNTYNEDLRVWSSECAGLSSRLN